jgi:hypothetical protein
MGFAGCLTRTKWVTAEVFVRDAEAGCKSLERRSL